MNNKKRKTITNTPSGTNNKNYFSPLQTIEDDDLEDNEVIVEKKQKCSFLQ